MRTTTRRPLMLLDFGDRIERDQASYSANCLWHDACQCCHSCHLSNADCFRRINNNNNNNKHITPITLRCMIIVTNFN